jgi:acetolactate synthase-1/2/3 large subunit
MAQMMAADAMVRILESEGVGHVFGVPGAHILPFYDALTRTDKVEAVLARHEGGAAFMARMYARASGRVGVCAATAGPGATNLVTGVADAYAENVPMVVLTGQVATRLFGRNAAQEATGEPGTPDQVALFAAITKASTQVTQPDQVPRKLREAFRIATAEPMGPVHLSLPSDVQGATIEFEPMDPSGYRAACSRAVDLEGVRRLVGLLMEAERPALVVGRRARLAGAGPAVRRLMDDFGIPVTTSVVAKGMVPEDAPLSLGTLHMFGHRAADKYLYEADLVVAAGESFEEYTSNYYEEELIPAAGLVHIDSAPYEIGRNYPVRLGIVGHVAATLEALCQELEAAGYAPRPLASQVTALKESTRHFNDPGRESPDFPLKPQRLFAALGDLAEDHSFLVQTDMGQNFFWSLRQLQVRDDRYFGTWGFMPMGSGVAGAVGLALARPGTRVVCVCGDGSMQMQGMEIATAVERNLPVTWVVLNDGRLNMVHMAQGLSYGERYIATEMRNPAFARWAESHGARGLQVEDAAGLTELLGQALTGEGPVVVDVPIDGDELLPVKPRLILLAKKMGLDVSDSRTACRALRKVLDER